MSLTCGQCHGATNHHCTEHGGCGGEGVCAFCTPAEMAAPKSLRELQTTLPFTTHFHHDFRASPMSHKDFAHALNHVVKASGKLATLVDDAEHKGHDFQHSAVAPYVADLVVCALRMANVCPNGVIDLQAAVEARIAAKNPREVTP